MDINKKNKDYYAEPESSKRIRHHIDNMQISVPNDGENTSQLLLSDNISRCVSLPESIAALCVSGLLKHIPYKYIGQCDGGNVILIYAKEEKNNIFEALKEPNDIYKAFVNAVIMGNICEDIFPSNSYVGLIKVGEKQKDSISIIDAEMLDSPITTSFDKNYRVNSLTKTHKHKIKYITLKNRVVRLPLSKMSWDNFLKDKWMYLFIEKHEIKRLSPLFGYADFFDWLLYTDDMSMMLTPMKKEAAHIDLNTNVNDIPNGLMLQIDLKKMKEISLPEDLSTPTQNTITWILDWNCVEFKQNYIVVYPPKNTNIQFNFATIHTPNSIEAFNYLKDYLKERLSPIHCTIKDKSLKIVDQIRLNDAIKLFMKSYKQNGISVGIQTQSHSPRHTSFDNALLQSNKMTEEEFFKYKSEYINYLVSIQSKKHKIIPCVESLSHVTGEAYEYAFIFSSKCKNGNFLIVHENVNSARSTIFFVVKKNSYEDSIRIIYEFLHSSEVNKRSNIQENNLKIDNPNIVKYGSIDHNYINEWKAYLLYHRGYRDFIYY